MPEPVYTADDFDNECADIMKHDLFDAFLSQAMSVNSEIQGGGIDEDAMKKQIMVDGVEAFREAFERYVNAASAKSAKAETKIKSKAKAPGKKAPAKKAAEPAGDDREFDELVQSKIWQEMSALKQIAPDIYKEESGGKEPRTIPACIDLVQRINDRLDAAEDIPG